MNNNKKYTTIYIVRHGETEWNIKGLLQGHADSPLTKEGKKQAQKLAQEFRRIHFDEVFSSDLLRAKRTAEIILLERKIAVKTTKALRERSYGKLEGVKWEEFFKLFKKWKKLSEKERFKYKVARDIESDEEITSRFITFLREIAVLCAGKTVLIVSHAGIMRHFLIHIGFGDYDTIQKVENAAVIKVLCDGVDFFVKEAKGIQTTEKSNLK